MSLDVEEIFLLASKAKSQESVIRTINDSNIYLWLKVKGLHNTQPLSSLAKELPAVASVMQSSSKELSTLVADRVLKKCKQRLLLLLFLKIKIP